MNKKQIQAKLKELNIFGKVISVLVIVILSAVIYILASQDGVESYGQLTMSDLDLPDTDLQIITDVPPLEGFAGYEPVEKTDVAVLYVNTQTTGIALQDRNTGKVYFTQLPEELIMNAGAANMVLSGQMQSNFFLTIANLQSGSESVYSAYTHSVDSGNFAIENISKGVRLHYLVGRIPKERVVPLAITAERFEEIVGELDTQDQREFRSRYMQIDPDKIDDTQERNEMTAKYPVLEDGVAIYVLRPQLQEFILDRLDNALREQNYSMEDKAADENSVFLDEAEVELPDIYKLQLDFTLDRGKLVVALEKGNILHTDTTIPLHIAILPYFFSADINDEGYFLLPDGSGSLMYFNNGKTNASIYSARIFGHDPVELPTITRENTLQTHLPVFGMMKNGNTMFARITGSAADARIFADISGKTSNINTVYPRFTLRDFRREVVYRDWQAGHATVYANRIQPGELSGRIEVEYHLMDESQQGYSGMAQLYRELLIEENVLKKQDTENDRLLLRILGSAEIVKSYAGIPIRINEVMTTFDQAQDMFLYLQDRGVYSDLRYLGAVNGGINQRIANRITFLRSLGGTKGYDRLSDLINESDGNIFMELDLVSVQSNRPFDGFIKFRDAAMNLSRKKQPSYDRDPVTFYYVLNQRYMLSPPKVQEISESLFESLKRNNVSGISLDLVARTVSSDFNPNNTVPRSESVEYYMNALSNISSACTSIMASGANAYTLEFADYIADMPSQSNRYRITDGCVPFYQMVVYGFIPFSYGPINIDTRPDKLFLQSVATGANLSAMVSWNDTSVLKKTDYPMMYSANWDSSKDLIIEYNEKYQSIRSHISGRTMKDYVVHAPGVSMTVFSGGTVILVNLGQEPYTYKGQTVNGMDYLILQEGDIS